MLLTSVPGSGAAAWVLGAGVWETLQKWQQKVWHLQIQETIYLPDWRSPEMTHQEGSSDFIINKDGNYYIKFNTTIYEPPSTGKETTLSVYLEHNKGN